MINKHEWDAAEPTSVQLASGTTSDFRLKKGTRILLSHPTGVPTLIVPMSALDELDYKLEWSGGTCRIQDHDGRALTVTVINGCPMIPVAGMFRALSTTSKKEVDDGQDFVGKS